MGFADTPQPDDTGEEYDKKFTFRYFTLANSIPIRVLVYPDNAGRVNAKDLWAMSQVLDKESGEFKQSQHLTKINWDDAGEYEEVSKEDFYQKCDEYLEYWTPEKIKDSKEGMERFQKLIDEGFFDD